nr:hypothetical protein [Allomuricauda sp.]
MYDIDEEYGNYIPIKLSFRVSNLDSESLLYLSTIELNHSIETIDVGKKTNPAKPIFWGLSSQTFIYEDSQQTTDVRFQEIPEKELRNKRLNESISVQNLGLFSYSQNNKNLTLEKTKVSIAPESIKYFEFIFLISDEIIKKYTQLLPINSELYEVNDTEDYMNLGNDGLNLLNGTNEEIKIENIKSLRLNVSLFLSSAVANGEFKFMKNYRYE